MSKKHTLPPLMLGQKVDLPANPDVARIECVPYSCNYKPWQSPSWTRFVCPEFTSLCPVTDQPDFGTITVDYAPDKLLIESKSLKLYLASFRNHGAFHEQCVELIADKLFKAANPHTLRVVGAFRPRGGIAIMHVASRDNGNVIEKVNCYPLPHDV